MAVMTADTFDPLRRHVSVRMQQGVPLVDADWNEREDAQRFALRAFLRWFAGDGVPFASDGFLIEATGATNDFTLRGSAATPPDALTTAGRALAGGGEALVAAPQTAFRQQPLHVARGPSAVALAAALKVSTIDELPDMTGVVIVYLDVWERLVSGVEDPGIVLPGIGTESCARVRREWAVRARVGASLPSPGQSDHRPGHAYAELAQIARTAGAPAVRPRDLRDRRERRLLQMPATLLDDVYGTAGATPNATVSAARRGSVRPPISYRAAIDALLLGRLPGSPDVELAAPVGVEVVLGLARDGRGSLVAPIVSNRANPAGPGFDIFVSRAPLDGPVGFASPTQVTSGQVIETAPHLVVAGPDDLVLTYAVPTPEVVFRRGSFAGLANAPTTAIAGGDYESPIVAIIHDTATFAFFDSTAEEWQFRRYDLGAGQFLDAGPTTLLAAQPGTDPQAARPVVDAADNAWFALSTQPGSTGLQVIGIDAAGNVVDTSPVLAGSGPGGPIELPSLLADAAGDVWVFYSDFQSGIWQARRDSGTWTPEQRITITQPRDGFPYAALDPTGGFWLVWQRGGVQPVATYLAWHNPVTDGWAPPRRVTTSRLTDAFAFPHMEPDGSLWVAWSRTLGSFRTRVHLKRVHTTV